MKQWRKVPGYENYEISIETREGKCRSLNYLGHKGIVKELHNTPGKYTNRIYWGLTKNGKKCEKQAAVWIALTYPELIENEYFKGAEIDHINTDPLDNRPCNLRWVDRAGQMNNPLTKIHNAQAQSGKHLTEETKNKLRIASSGIFKNRKNQSTPVEQYTLEGTYVSWYPSQMEAERKTGIAHTHISACCKGKINQIKGYVFKYKST